MRLKACGVCHTDLYTASGADPSGYAPTVLGHEGAGVVEEVGEGVTSVAPGDHVVTLFSPQCRECIHCVSDKTNICLAIREQQNKGYLPDGTTRLHRNSDDIRHFMGTSTFAEATVMPEIALAKVNPEAPLDVVCTLACGATTASAPRSTSPRSSPAPRARSSAPGWWASARWQARGSRGPSGSSPSTCPRSGSSTPASRAPPTRSWAAPTASSRSLR